MDYKEKYEQALEKARELMDRGYDVLMPEIFSELQENEDEKVRREIRNFIWEYPDKLPERTRWLAWFEKQEEKNINHNIDIKEKAHQIAWETSKDYDPLSSKESWCEMAALDMASWFEKQGEYSWKPTEEQLEALDYAYNNCSDTERGNYYERVLADLIADLHKLYEKQDEEKPTDKIEPKFKVGDWVLNNVCFPMQIASIKDGMYIFTEGDAMSVLFIDGNYHLWTIHDAMDGDVLVNWNNTTFIFKAIEDKTVKFHIAYNEKLNTIKTPLTKLSHQGLAEPQFEFHPATKEQCDTLFAKMKEAGYEWDADKKELKKIESKTLDVWNAEDEQNLNVVLSFIPDECLRRWLKDKLCYDTLDANKVIEWLKDNVGVKDITEQWQEKILKSNINTCLILHESGTKDYHLYLSIDGRKMSDFKFNEEEIVKFYNAIKKTLELEKLI